MTRSTRFSGRTVFWSTMAACSGDALYRWQRHGSVDWIAVLEFGIGWAFATAVILAFSFWRQQRQDLDSTGSTA